VNEKTKFLVRELWTLAWAASVQHAKIYKTWSKANSKERKDFRDEIATYVATKLLPMYKKRCVANQHCENIEALVTYATEVGAGVLSRAGYKFGVAQKLLNLCLIETCINA
jgi:hypothetical protein